MFSSLFYVFTLFTLNTEFPIRKMLQRKKESLLQLSTDNHGPQSSSLESIFVSNEKNTACKGSAL